jgi:signal recognition particle subunit SRP54
MDMLPEGMAENLDDRELVKIEAMISSFTPFERQDPHALIREPGRAKRIARGSGTKPGQAPQKNPRTGQMEIIEVPPENLVTELVQKFLMMKQMMDGLGSNLGLLGKIPGMKNLGMANALRKMQKGGGMPDLGALGGLGNLSGLGGLGGLGDLLGGMGGEEGPSLTKMKALTEKERNAKKAARKREKEARRKSRR